MKGPAVFLAQFLRDAEPFCSATSLGKWFAGHLRVVPGAHGKPSRRVLAEAREQLEKE